MKQAKTIGIAAVIVIGLVLGKDLIAGAVFSGGVKAITGLETQIKSLRVGLLKTSIGISGLRVLNPRGFQDRVLVEIPEIYVDYKLSALLKGKAHLQTVRLHLSELTVAKAPDGKLNLDSVKALESGKAKEEAKKPQPGRAPEFQIDVLELKIGKVIYKDYTASPPTMKEFAVNIDQRYEHITNPYVFAGLVASQALMKTTVAQLADFDVRGLQSNVTQALKVSASQVTSRLPNTTAAAEQFGKDAVGTAQDAVEQTAGTLKKLLGN